MIFDMTMTVDDVVARLYAIDAALPPDDGVAVFNDVYLQVTETVRDQLATGGVFADDAFMTALDVLFASLWFDAHAAAATSKPKAWAPLFEHRGRALLPIQFALAGMNTHIEHDLPVAVVRACLDHDREPKDIRDDYEKVNDVLAAIESDIRRSFLDDLQLIVDEHVGGVAHLVSSWSIDKARESAWVNVQVMWQLRHTPFLSGLHADALASAVGLGSRLLLTKC